MRAGIGTLIIDFYCTLIGIELSTGTDRLYIRTNQALLPSCGIDRAVNPIYVLFILRLIVSAAHNLRPHPREVYGWDVIQILSPLPE
jgi:hypothetical protein